MNRFALALVLVLAVPATVRAEDSPQLQMARQLYQAGVYEDAFAVLQPLALTGDAEAQNLLGYMYEHGQGVAADPQAAVDAYRRSAEGGNAMAMVNIGLVLRDGDLGQVPDPATAKSWFERAVAAGNTVGHVELGVLYERGSLGVIDLVEAERQYRLAADAGQPIGMYDLAVMYRLGHGVAVDFAQARHWFAEAGMLGAGAAVGNLGVMMELGEGGPVDLDGARAAYEAAMRMGEAESAYWAAWMYADNPAHFADPVRGLAYCGWALVRATPPQAAAWSPRCDGWFGALSPDEKAAAAALAQEM